MNIGLHTGQWALFMSGSSRQEQKREECSFIPWVFTGRKVVETAEVYLVYPTDYSTGHGSLTFHIKFSIDLSKDLSKTHVQYPSS